MAEIEDLRDRIEKLEKKMTKTNSIIFVLIAVSIGISILFYLTPI